MAGRGATGRARTAPRNTVPVIAPERRARVSMLIVAAALISVAFVPDIAVRRSRMAVGSLREYGFYEWLFRPLGDGE